MANDWIKIHRKITEWEWHDVPEMVSLWVHLLAMANWEDEVWKGVSIKRGQLLTSYRGLAKASGLSVRQVRTCIARLTMSKNIKHTTTHVAAQPYTIITISNYESYQENEGKSDTMSDICPTHQPTHQPTHPQPLVTPYNSDSYKDNENGATHQPTHQPTHYKRNNINNNISNRARIEAEPEPVYCPTSLVVDFWNTTMTEFPRISSLSETRRVNLEARWQEWAKMGDPVMVFKSICAKILKSPYCKGQNQIKWKATFDWLVKNDTNGLAVLEGQYDYMAANNNTLQQPAAAPKGEVAKDVNSKWKR